MARDNKYCIKKAIPPTFLDKKGLRNYKTEQSCTFNQAITEINTDLMIEPPKNTRRRARHAGNQLWNWPKDYELYLSRDQQTP